MEDWTDVDSPGLIPWLYTLCLEKQCWPIFKILSAIDITVNSKFLASEIVMSITWNITQRRYIPTAIFGGTAQHSSSGRQPKFVALNRGGHLHSAGRPSCSALAHVLAGFAKMRCAHWGCDRLVAQLQQPIILAICAGLVHGNANGTRMWANAQPDGHPAEHRWCPLFNAAKFGWRPLLDAVQ